MKIIRYCPECGELIVLTELGSGYSEEEAKNFGDRYELAHAKNKHHTTG